MAIEQYNFFGYRITDNRTFQVANNVTAAFKYRGHEVAFNTFAPGGMRVSVYKDGSHIAEYASVEAAIAAVDEVIDWKSGTKGHRILPNPNLLGGWQQRRRS